MINLENLFEIMGCILIVVSSAGIGVSVSQELQKHLDELEELKHIFYLLRSELQYTKAPFAEVFEKVGNKTSGMYGDWLMAISERLTHKGTGLFWDIWCVTIEEKLKKSSLKKDEIQELKDIGKNLDYIESIDLFIEQLEYRIKHTRESYRSKKKICKSMGITGGVFLVILLV